MDNKVLVSTIVRLMEADEDAHYKQQQKKFARRRLAIKLAYQRLFTYQRNQLISVWMMMAEDVPPEFTMEAFKYRKKIWMKERSNDFWIRIVNIHFKTSEWIENFRMSKVHFLELCKILFDELKPKPQLLSAREPLSVEKQVAVALFKLSSCAEYRVIGNLFGIHKATVKKCLYRVVTAIKYKVMVRSYICMPKDDEAKVIAQGFQEKSNVPQVFGCIDGTHIPITAPNEGYRDYVNRKGWTSYNVLAVVDNNGRFRCVTAKHPGAAHDAAVFKDSLLFKNSENILPQGTIDIDGLEVPLFIVGDPAYPLLPWLLKGYPGHVSAEEESFNVHLSSARIAVEMAFGRLKARWKILAKQMDCDYKFSSDVIITCCILHNFVEEKKDLFYTSWLQESEQYGLLYPQPERISFGGRVNLNGAHLRDHLKQHLAKCYSLRKAIMRA